MGFKLRMGMGFEHKASSRIEQRQSLPLGKFEEQLKDKIEFIGIQDPQNTYHQDMLDALLTHWDGEEKSLIAQIVLERELTSKKIDKIIVESFQADDVSFDVGTKRNVDRFILKFADQSEIVMTVSLDKRGYNNKDSSPSLNETGVLNQVEDPISAWSVQQWYGSTYIEDRNGIRGLICKEYISGTMLANYTADIGLAIDTHGKKTMDQIGYEVGRMVANSLTTLGGVPIDSNGLNIIIANQTDDSIRARYCDTEKIRTSKEEITKEINLIRKELGILGSRFMKGLKENYSGNLLA